jgi:hypothetical protein
MKEILKKDILIVFMITVTVVAMIFASMYISKKIKWSNDDEVVTQFIYQQLNICNKKLATHGENVELDIPKHKAKAKDLNVCIEKLGAYGEDITLPLK